MKKMNIVIYSKDHCPNCVTAKAMLASKSISFEEKKVEDPEVLKELLEKYPEAKQLPQIFIDDQRVGGLAGLTSALKQLGY
jgi:glutaredoxin 3